MAIPFRNTMVQMADTGSSPTPAPGAGKIQSKGDGPERTDAPKKELPNTTLNRVTREAPAPDTGDTGGHTGGSTPAASAPADTTAPAENQVAPTPAPAEEAAPAPSVQDTVPVTADKLQPLDLQGMLPNTADGLQPLNLTGNDLLSLTGTPISQRAGGEVNLDRSQYYDTAQLENYLRRQTDAAQQQSDLRIDNAVQQNAQALNDALAEAQSGYQTARNQAALNEQQALDNQVLYNAARGDNGGVGLAQYNAIQNTAAQNEMAISNAQTEMAANTAQQIAQLRAQGEFQKADNLLSITQEYLANLMAIEQWGAQYNLNVDQINQALAQWEANYRTKLAEMDLDEAATRANIALNEANYNTNLAEMQFNQNAARANTALQEANYNAQLAEMLFGQNANRAQLAMSEAGLTGQYNGRDTYQARMAQAEQAQTERQNAQSLALSLAGQGIMPDKALLEASGLDAATVASVVKANTKKRGGSGKSNALTAESVAEFINSNYAYGQAEGDAAVRTVMNAGLSSGNSVYAQGATMAREARDK